MSSYTTPLSAIIESYSQYEGGLTHSERIEIGRKHLFDFYYPIFDEDYRANFERNLIRYFYMREIGFETEGRFKFQLESWLLLNMPYFNKLFESELIKYDPLTNVQLNTGHERLNQSKTNDERLTKHDSQSEQATESETASHSSGQGTTVEDNFNRNVSSNNPDQRLALTTQQGKGVIEYASNIDENKIDNTSKGTSSSEQDTVSQDEMHAKVLSELDDKFTSKHNTNEHYFERKFGKIGDKSFSQQIQEYRQALLRVELQIYNEMQELFMLVY